MFSAPYKSNLVSDLSADPEGAVAVQDLDVWVPHPAAHCCQIQLF